MDFGASRVKAVLVDITKVKVVDSEECISPSVKSFSFKKNTFEVPVEHYWEALLNTVGKILLRHPSKKIGHLWICAEMHGFVLASLNGSAVTPYISWKDERANSDSDSGDATFKKMKEELVAFRSITGMHIKSGLPVLTLASLARHGEIEDRRSSVKKGTFRVLTLVDWLLYRGGEPAPKTNITLSAGLGIYDIHKRDVSQEILNHQFLRNLEVAGLEVQSSPLSALGCIRIFNSDLSVFGGLGDFQAAIHGAGFLRKYDAAINLGTGSQIVVKTLDPILAERAEVRPMLDNSHAVVVTHIPCGRALNVFASFFDSVSFASEGRSFFWETWASMNCEEIMASQVISNLALFESAWGKDGRYPNGWIGLNEGSSSARDAIASIAKTWLLQYSQALHAIDPKAENRKVVVCGGVGQKSKFVVPVLQALMPYRDFKLASPLTGEHTLDGLLHLARQQQ